MWRGQSRWVLSTCRLCWQRLLKGYCPTRSLSGDPKLSRLLYNTYTPPYTYLTLPHIIKLQYNSVEQVHCFAFEKPCTFFQNWNEKAAKTWVEYIFCRKNKIPLLYSLKVISRLTGRAITNSETWITRIQGQLGPFTSQGHGPPLFKVPKRKKKNPYPFSRWWFPVSAVDGELEQEHTLGAEEVKLFLGRCKIVLSDCPRKTLRCFFPLCSVLNPRRRKGNVRTMPFSLRWTFSIEDMSTEIEL